MKILTIIGARPQFIKAAVVSRAIIEYKKDCTRSTEDLNEIIIHTGQHFERNMSGVFFEEMRIPEPNIFLGINSLSHGAMTGQMLERLEAVLAGERPDMVLVYGDTNSTLAGALAAAKLHIPIAHVEAGLRSFNRRMPEEINRVLTDHLSDLLFCPTERAVNNLRLEGIESRNRIKGASENHRLFQQVELVGDVMCDAALFYRQFARPPAIEIPDNYILTTIHRAENTDDEKNLRSIFRGLDLLGREVTILMPLHPRTRERLKQLNIGFNSDDVKIIDPVGYLEMLYLLDGCNFVMTDSGGLQKEAYFFKKTCLTLREETEWVELVDNGYNLLCGADSDKIYSGYLELKCRNPEFSATLYGHGNAGDRIVEILVSR